MIKKIIDYIKERKEIRRRKRVAKFMWDQTLSSHDYFMGWSDESDEESDGDL
ncbi:hypothetical protein LCGC14_1334630 [marine sediment metagenome]|uniref:Uncharacterized protein n=1 Tax=marine sediment metagenome TaxID=412755 RepID=A0A0F9MWC9_9ZZZZ